MTHALRAGRLSVSLIVRFHSDFAQRFHPPCFRSGSWARSIAPLQVRATSPIKRDRAEGNEEEMTHGRLSTSALVSIANSRRFARLRSILCADGAACAANFLRWGKPNRRPGHRTETEGPRCEHCGPPRRRRPAGACKILAVRRRRAAPELYRGLSRVDTPDSREAEATRRAARRGQQQDSGTAPCTPIGAIVPWPMPPALIIRQCRRPRRDCAFLAGLRRWLPASNRARADQAA